MQENAGGCGIKVNFPSTATTKENLKIAHLIEVLLAGKGTEEIYIRKHRETKFGEERENQLYHSVVG